MNFDRFVYFVYVYTQCGSEDLRNGTVRPLVLPVFVNCLGIFRVELEEAEKVSNAQLTGHDAN